MESVLTDLYFGNIDPSKEAPFNKELKEKLTKIENELLELLDDEGKGLFNSYIDLQFSLSNDMTAESFKQGYQLGARTTAEALG